MTWNEPANDRRISALSSEWAKLSTLAAWEASVERLRAEHQRLRRQGRWLGGPRDFLGVLGRSEHELTHSAVLAWLLDPGMRHGLGSRFLRRVLQRCCHEAASLPDDLEQANSETEVARGSGRADIVVWGASFTLVIENKVGAAEGEGQCDFYYRAFKKEPRPFFVFLSPDGRNPESVGPEAAEAYTSVSYANLAADLDETLDSPEVNREAEARSVAVEYLASLRNRFVNG